MTPTVNISYQPVGDLAWVFLNDQFVFTREIGTNYRTALKRVANVDLSLAFPYGILNTSANRLIVDFEDEYIYVPYSKALKGLRDLELIRDNTIIQFAHFERHASFVFKEIVHFEQNEVINGLARDLERTFRPWGS